MTKLPASIEAKRDELADSYGANSRHLKTSQHFKDGFNAGYFTHAELVTELLWACELRMKSDEACGHPFDEDLGTALATFREKMETK